MRRILVPTDFSDPSRQALHYALALTAAVEGDLYHFPLTILHKRGIYGRYQADTIAERSHWP
jgi:nucleotide-binding universal stress UspA family protein